MQQKSQEVTIIVLLMGRYEALSSQFAELVEQLKALPNADVVVVADGQAWTSAPLFQMLDSFIPNATVLSVEEETSSPARLIELALSQARGQFLQLVYPLGAPVAPRYQLFKDAIQKAEDTVPTTYCIRNAENCPPYIYVNQGNVFGFCQCADIYLLDELCISKEYLLSCCPLDKALLLREQFEKWLTMMLMRGTEMVVVGAMTRSSVPMRAYPFRYKQSNGDLAWRYALYSAAPTKPLRRNRVDVYADFLRDIPDEEARRLMGTAPCNSGISAPKYKILLVGGWWEYHHNQICFQNYFESMQGTSFATFRTAFEVLLRPSELVGYDLVIFTRCRSDAALRLIHFCNEQKIHTLYMIDDNWMSFAKDFPKLGGMFVPGNPNYDNFISAIGMVDAVWLFNPYLEEDIKPYCKRTLRFQISVLPSLYEAPNPRIRADDALYVGYAGSLRWSNSIFEALARIAREDDRVKVVLLGVMSEEQLALFHGLDVIYEPFVSYSRYTALMGTLRPDLLLAPLVNSRTNRSKCYNKYIEFGVVGAAGIYSRYEPYTFVVEDGKTGYFVDADDADAWYSSLCNVLSDIPALREVQCRAQADVLANHTVEAVIDEFRRKLCSVIEEGGQA